MLSHFLELNINWRLYVHVRDRELIGICSLADSFSFGESCTSISVVAVFAILTVKVYVLMLSQFLESNINWRVYVYVPNW
jgi:hypothetical protein